MRLPAASALLLLAHSLPTSAHCHVAAGKLRSWPACRASCCAPAACATQAPAPPRWAPTPATPTAGRALLQLERRRHRSGGWRRRWPWLPPARSEGSPALRRCPQTASRAADVVGWEEKVDGEVMLVWWPVCWLGHPPGLQPARQCRAAGTSSSRLVLQGAVCRALHGECCTAASSYPHRRTPAAWSQG